MDIVPVYFPSWKRIYAWVVCIRFKAKEPLVSQLLHLANETGPGIRDIYDKFSRTEYRAKRVKIRLKISIELQQVSNWLSSVSNRQSV